MKKFLVYGIFMLVLLPLQAQVRFMHSAGATYLLGLSPDVFIGTAGLTYNPRIHFGSDNASIALSTAPTIGFDGAYNSRSGGEGSIVLDLPINLQFHWGLGASRDTDKNLGFYGGIGLGYTYMGQASTFIGAYDGSFLGPLFEGGVNFIIYERPVGLRAKYMIDTKAENAKVFAVGIMYHFGY
ncbi:MAG TPA: hypothetical protein ENJ82_04640 [Bacteroidetes bacterium]|nr:hypothetical protein [Bacteroidota bacterium]